MWERSRFCQKKKRELRPLLGGVTVLAIGPEVEGKSILLWGKKRGFPREAHPFLRNKGKGGVTRGSSQEQE